MSSELALETKGGRWKRYPAYRDSGVEWLGDVPEEWGVKRMDAFTSIFKHSVSAELLSGQEVFHYSIPIVQEKGTGELEDGGGIESNKTLITEEVLLVSKLNPRKGTIALASPHQAITVCSGEFVPLVPRKCFPKYLEYVYCSEDVRQLLSSRVESVTKSHQRVNPIEIYKMFWSWPSFPEQRAIVAFLDRETGSIDTLIAKKERQIELLQEKRAALISHAVTKGLDPDIKMKDSGVEWLGEVPEEWDSKRLKYISSVNDETLSETTDSDFELLYVDISSIDPVSGIKNKELMTFENAPSRARRKVCCGDVIISTVRTYLRAISPINNPEPNMIVSTGFAVIRPKEGLYSQFAAYALRAPYFVDEVVANSVGVSYPAINASELITFNIVIPPLPEQSAIAAFLDRETGRIDTLVKKIQESISKLREYRTALISAAVTGKIDVRED